MTIPSDYISHLQKELPIASSCELTVEIVEDTYIIDKRGYRCDGLFSWFPKSRRGKIQVATGERKFRDLRTVLITLAHEYRHAWQRAQAGIPLNGFSVAAELDAHNFGLVAAERYLGNEVSADLCARLAEGEARLLRVAGKM